MSATTGPSAFDSDSVMSAVDGPTSAVLFLCLLLLLGHVSFKLPGSTFGTADISSPSAGTEAYFSVGLNFCPFIFIDSRVVRDVDI